MKKLQQEKQGILKSSKISCANYIRVKNLYITSKKETMMLISKSSHIYKTESEEGPGEWEKARAS